jgi:hypothetical protein
MYPMSINSISVLHTSWMIPREVDPVEANPYKKLFYLSFDPLVNDDAATVLSSFREMKKTSKIRLPPSPPTPFRSICLHSNQRSSPAHLPTFFLSFLYYFCSSCTLHLHVCVDCENGVSS